MSYQRRFYILTNLDNGTKITIDGKGSNNEPKGWDDSEKTWKRSTKDFSFTFEFSKNLEFTGSGASFLREAYNSRDVEANVEMTEYRFNPNTDEPYVYSIALFDFSQIDRQKTVVKIPFKSGGLKSLLKSKFNDKFELERTEAINGNVLDPLVKQEFAVINKPIFKDSLLETEEEQNSSEVFRMGFSNDYRYGFHPIPTKVTYESDDSVLQVVNDQFKVMGFEVNLSNEMIQDAPFNGIRANTFYSNSDVDKTLSLDIDLKINVDLIDTENLRSNHLSLRLMKVGGDDDPTLNIAPFNVSETTTGERFPDLPQLINIQNLNDIWISNPKDYTISLTEDINLKKGESLALYMFGGGEFQQATDTAYLYLDFANIECSISIKETSVRNDVNRRALCVLNKDIGEREMQIITGEKNRYYSESLTNGAFGKTALTSGKLIRGFNDSKLTVSLKDFINNCNSLFNMGYNVEIINGKEVLVHEEMKHFFRQEVSIVIPNQVNNVKRTVANEFIYSTIKSGYKKPSGDILYEDINGLSEVNTSNSYITNITRVEKEYNIESPYRFDSEGKELTVRQSISVNPNGDYRTDNTNFNLDLKNTGTSVLEEKIWSDYYEQLPKSNGTTPIFSPETMTGVYFTPFRNMQRHFWFLNNALTKFRDKYIRYTETRGNSEFVTKKAGEEEKAENGKYLVSDIETPRFVSQWIEFEYELDFDLLNAVNGKTNVNGRDIPNTYFRIEFVNEFNEKEFGYLFELKPNKEGKWKVLKAI